MLTKVFSNTFLIAAIGFSALSPIGAVAQSSECSSIENDIARLACFDAAFPEVAEAPLSIEDAAQNLRDVIQMDTPYETVGLWYERGSPCQIKVIIAKGEANRHAREHNKEQRNYAYVSGVDLSKVERLGRWVFDGASVGGIQLVAERGSVVRSQIFHGHTPQTKMANLSLSNLQGNKAYINREATFYLLAKDYRQDAQKAEEALQAYVDACRG